MKEDQKENRPEGRLFAIGDIHGCSTALRTLIEAIDPRPEDSIVTLGDYIDWGPDSRGVIDVLIGLSGRCNLVPLLGNHEEMLLAALKSGSELRYWLKFGGEETLDSYQYDGRRDMIPEDHVRFIRGCRDFYETPTHIFVHANYDHRLPMDRIGSTKLRWEHIDPKAQQPHYSGKIVVVGHTPQVSGDVLDLGLLVCIDTDCSRGGRLTAFDAKTGDLIQANERGELRSGSSRGRAIGSSLSNLQGQHGED
jgi:serine/threonine protein phosphatase 1